MGVLAVLATAPRFLLSSIEFLSEFYFYFPEPACQNRQKPYHIETNIIFL